MRLPLSPRFLLLHALLLCFSMARAQELKLPPWMLDILARDRPASTDNTALYKAFGANNSRTNRFIGSFTMQVSMTMDGTPVELTLEHWSDSTRAVARLRMPEKKITLTYLADLSTNTAIHAEERPEGKKAMINDLRDLILLNGPIAQKREQVKVIAGKGRETIAGVSCRQHSYTDAGASVELWLSDLPSPFVDADNWVPLLQGPLTIYAMPGLHGDPMPLRWKHNTIVGEVTALHQGTVAIPTMDLATYTVEDKRKPRTPTITIPPRPSPQPSKEALEPAELKAMRTGRSNAFRGQVSWTRRSRTKGHLAFQDDENRTTVVATEDTLLLLNAHPGRHPNSSYRYAHSSGVLEQYSTLGAPRKDKVVSAPNDAAHPFRHTLKPTGRSAPFDIALPLQEPVADDGTPTPTRQYMAQEYISILAEKDTFIVWVVPEIPSPFHDLYGIGHPLHGALSWANGVWPVEGLPVYVWRCDEGGAGELRITEYGEVPSARLFREFDKDPLGIELTPAIPDRPDIYKEALGSNENRFTGHVHLSYGTPGPEKSGTRIHWDWYATKDRMLLVETTITQKRAWAMDRQRRTTVEYRLVKGEVQRMDSLGSLTHIRPLLGVSDSLVALGKDTTTIGMRGDWYLDPSSMRRMVHVPSTPSFAHDLYGHDPRLLCMGGGKFVAHQPLEGLITFCRSGHSPWIMEVHEVDHAPVDEQVFTITPGTWRE